LKIGRGKNIDEQQFAKRGFKSCASQDLNPGRLGRSKGTVTVCCVAGFALIQATGKKRWSPR
jgi:hypothetical protein